MTITELMTALCDLDSVLYVDDAGALRYAGPRLPADHAIRAAIATHRAELIELFTYAPGRRCVFTGCYRLVAEGIKVACSGHCIVIDHELAALEAAQTGTSESEAA